MTKFAEFYTSQKLNSCYGPTPNPLNFTTFHARTHLQPQLNKVKKYEYVDRVRGCSLDMSLCNFNHISILPKICTSCNAHSNTCNNTSNNTSNKVITQLSLYTVNNSRPCRLKRRTPRVTRTPKISSCSSPRTTRSCPLPKTTLERRSEYRYALQTVALTHPTHPTLSLFSSIPTFTYYSTLNP